MTIYAKERDCVDAAENTFYETKQQQLIFRKGRKYIHVTGELTQRGQPFKNIFGETLYYPEYSDIRKEYEANGYVLRGWVNTYGSFKNN